MGECAGCLNGVVAGAVGNCVLAVTNVAGEKARLESTVDESPLNATGGESAGLCVGGGGRVEAVGCGPVRLAAPDAIDAWNWLNCSVISVVNWSDKALWRESCRVVSEEWCPVSRTCWSDSLDETSACSAATVASAVVSNVVTLGGRDDEMDWIAVMRSW